MNLPSADQSLNAFVSDEEKRSCSLPPPLAGLRYKSRRPFLVESNNTSLPSGDQIGNASGPGSKVKRTVRDPSISQTSVLPCWIRDTAIRLSSGDSFGADTKLSSTSLIVPRFSRCDRTT